jgi:hypothetical protein
MTMMMMEGGEHGSGYSFEWNFLRFYKPLEFASEPLPTVFRIPELLVVHSTP